MRAVFRLQQLAGNPSQLAEDNGACARQCQTLARRKYGKNEHQRLPARRALKLAHNGLPLACRCCPVDAKSSHAFRCRCRLNPVKHAEMVCKEEESVARGSKFEHVLGRRIHLCSRQFRYHLGENILSLERLALRQCIGLFTESVERSARLGRERHQHPLSALGWQLREHVRLEPAYHQQARKQCV
eukprot:scaffold246643_cov31-Tisochrysis_lutea.AAC.2